MVTAKGRKNPERPWAAEKALVLCDHCLEADAHFLCFNTICINPDIYFGELRCAFGTINAIVTSS
jgi:hypothetical protein